MSKRQITIAIDAMGGENSPYKCLKGIEIFFQKNPDVNFKIFGDEILILSSIKKRAFEHKNSICIGRSHGIHAEPTTFGLKLASFYAEFDRSLERLSRARDEISVCAISGAVGTFANIDPSVETYVASTQQNPRRY